MSCTNSWNENQKALEGERVHNLKFWRSLEFYIDPDSSKILELGTKDFPYRGLNIQLIELLHFHSHSEATINIHVIDTANLELSLSFAFIINITQVNIVSYTDVKETPNKAQITMTDKDVYIWNPKSLFTLISNDTLDPSEQITNRNLTEREKKQLILTGTGFMIDRSGFSMDSFIIQTDYTDQISIGSELFWSVYGHNHLIELTNLEINGKSNVFGTKDNLNLVMTNISIDYLYMSHPLNFDIDCSYSGAPTIGSVTLSNVTVFQSQEKPNNLTEQVFYFSGASNLAITGSSITIVVNSDKTEKQFYIEATEDCNPNDTEVQTYSISSTKFYYISDQVFSDLSMNDLVVFPTYYRQVEVSLRNNTYTATAKVGSIISIVINDDANVQIDSVQIDGLLFGESAVRVQGRGSMYKTYAELSSSLFSNLDSTGKTLVDLSTISHVVMNENIFKTIKVDSSHHMISFGSPLLMKMKGCTFSSIQATYDVLYYHVVLGILSLDYSEEGNHSISSTTITSSNVTFLEIDSVINVPTSPSQLTISGLEFKDSTFNVERNLLAFTKLDISENFTIILSDLKFSNINFKRSGNFLLLKHHTRNIMVIDGIKVTNTSLGHINVEATNTANASKPTKVSIWNVSTNEVNVGDNSLFLVLQNSLLQIYDSTIEYVYSTDGPCVFTIPTMNSRVELSNSTLRYNGGIGGGLIVVYNLGTFVAYNSSFIQNFATIASVIVSINNGIFEFYN